MTATAHPRLALALAATGAAVLVAGCGGNSPTGTNAANNRPANGIAAAYDFSRCMRQHGVSGFPDPHVSQGGGHTTVSLHVTPGQTGAPAFENAQKACRGYLPGPKSNDGSAAGRAAHVKGLISFARCMRTHQVQSFPDPTLDGQITPAMISGAGINLKAPAVRAAALACVPSSEGQLTTAQVEQALGPA